MSFILDALKKSESDRQRQSGPSLFEVKVTPPRRTLPVWAVVIAVLLGVNVIVISWMLLRHPAARQPAASRENTPLSARSTAQDTPSAPRAAVPSPVQGSPASAQAVAAPAVTTAATPPPVPTAAAATPPSEPTPAADGNPSDYAPAVEPTATASASPSAGAAEDLPIYQQIVTSDGLPALHLDLHVFANRPQDRFVMINMHRLGEGDSLPSGVHVDAIRPDGVVLSYQGRRFLLPRN